MVTRILKRRNTKWKKKKNLTKEKTANEQVLRQKQKKWKPDNMSLSQITNNMTTNKNDVEELLDKEFKEKL